jgi:NADH-quinone oxidoreductase subunit C
MQQAELKDIITGWLPGAAFDETGQWLNVNVEAKDLHQLALQLRDDNSTAFNYCFCLTCVDWKTHLSMVYHLDSTKYRHQVVLKVKLDAAKPEVDTVSDLWKTADFHEREVYEMFGVHFNNHPDLRLLILPDGWEGKNPLRKNFEDPINMIKL